ncbi:DMT family transporter [Blastochloris viridis]|uniref:Aromatic amino acid exporter YddG n=1 Tax=Blastochloris viridis TaxID=1079 RepID=A0A0H5BP56_BLAVI|nr:EamA family transporter [Blastochloris viridis]ALK07966.1 Aromatic amino acid exporter YddG [Blastochloris viridis]BAR98778.1 permease of the drug/metabolite transporter superfamily [Blastochloris viridis]CUU43888.1 Aromatic amino acid exporter YddG [Blastochloris viridis]
MIAASTTRSSTLVGLAAIALWSTLATLTAASGGIPPFQLAAVTFLIGSAVGAVRWIARPAGIYALRQPVPVWLLGVGGLFGYHALYFMALRLAPPAEAGLINYLWPLLIVLFSAALPGERLRLHHVVGAMLGFAGTIVVVTGGRAVAIDDAYLPGFAAAFVCAFVWATYSVLSRRLPDVPTDAVAGFCFVTAVLSALCHLAVEDTVWPAGATEWAAVVALGLGPVGLAFYVWDHGVKRGDIAVLGAASYAAPVLSTGLLVIAGYAAASWTLLAAAALITAGAVVAALDFFRR